MVFAVFTPEPYKNVVALVEQAAREHWKSEEVDKTLRSDDGDNAYVLAMFPYPSGNAHMGHVRVYSLSDVLARLLRFKGLNVLHPIGWDAFGLPAENAAIQRGVHPADWTARNIDAMRDSQLGTLGFSFDWSRELNTASPEYYRWTQWLFIQLHEAGLVERREAWVNWDPVDQTVLANEQVIDGRGWRTGAAIERKKLSQWFIRVTDFSEDLSVGLDELDGWSQEAVNVQRAWIGKSAGAQIDFAIEDSTQVIQVFTTRPDTLFGVTALVLAPEHPLTLEIVTPEQEGAVRKYIDQSLRRSEIERASEMSNGGVATGASVLHPLTDERIPIFVADYVIGSYGTGAVMSVPAHDARDHAFAKSQGLPIVDVIIRPLNSDLGEAYEGEGVLMRSHSFDGLSSAEGRTAITQALSESGKGRATTQYRLRDWLISRQRYWGAPIPMIHCDPCGWVAVPEKELPVLLPRDVDFKASGKSPLGTDASFVKAECPTCGGDARREVDTMDTFMCSSWYVWRFLNPNAEQVAWRSDDARKWFPIDYYVGGLEHAAQHMIYLRFMSHFLFSRGLTPSREPVKAFLDNGMIRLDGAKMSKSKGNVITPTEVVQEFGADALRLYILSDTPFNRDIDWDGDGLVGKQRFLAHIWKLYSDIQKAEISLNNGVVEPKTEKECELLRSFGRTVIEVEEDLLQRKAFNVAVARIHTFVNDFGAFLRSPDTAGWSSPVAQHTGQQFLKVLGVFAPHIAEVLWRESFDNKRSIFHEVWPTIDRASLEIDTVEYVLQVNGKKRGSILAARDISEEDLLRTILEDGNLKVPVNQSVIDRVIFVPNRQLMNLVIKGNP
jgi:leucyl-tRNA synthetase